MTEPRGTIGASDAAALFDEHPYISRYGLYLRETGMLRHVPDERTERQQIGLDLEEPVLRVWSAREGRDTSHNTQSQTATSLPGMSATPDGFEHDAESGAHIATVDVKTVRPYERRAWLDGIPKHYELQVQAQMAVCGVARGHLVALFGVDEISGTTLKANYDIQAEIVGRVDEFWRQVRGELPPPPADDHRATVAAMMAKQRERRTVDFADPRIAETMIMLDEDYQDATDALRDAKASQKRAKAAILNALADADRGVFPNGSGYAVEWQIRKAHEVKASKFAKLVRFTGENEEEGDDE